MMHVHEGSPKRVRGGNSRIGHEVVCVELTHHCRLPPLQVRCRRLRRRQDTAGNVSSVPNNLLL